MTRYHALEAEESGGQQRNIKRSEAYTPAGVYRPDLNNGRTTPTITNKQGNQHASFPSAKPLPMAGSEPSNPLNINNSHNGEQTNSDGDSSRIDVEDLFASLYPDVPHEDGLKASRNERLSEGYKSVSLTYGEISATGFIDVLKKIRDSYNGLPAAEGVFYDLGCGTGKPVFAVAATNCGAFRRCIGVEILSGLHGICQKALERWEGGIKGAVASERNEGGAAADIEFVCGDFTVLDWSDGDLVFANSTCFDDGLMEKMARRAEDLKEGAIVVTTTESVPSLAFEILEKTVMVQAGRGATTCFIQRRLPKMHHVPDTTDHPL